MCLLLVAWRNHPDYPLVVAANREEFYDRPAEPAHFWNDTSGVLAGRDKSQGGTWLGITRDGRFAAVTNFRQAGALPESGLSRGWLVRDFLQSSATDPALFTAGIATDQYRPFNLVAGNPNAMLYVSNQADGPVSLEPGNYGISNHLLNTPWPKLTRGMREFEEVMQRGVELDALFSLLADRTTATDADLPDTGVGLERERELSPIYVAMQDYGTRCATVIRVSQDGMVDFEERSFLKSGGAYQPDYYQARYFRFRLTV